MSVDALEVEGRGIGPKDPVFVIAEGSINHNGSVERAKKIIDAAYQAGADAVKFQKRNMAEVYQRKILEDPNSAEQKYQYLIPLLQEFALPDEVFVGLEAYAKERGIMFLVNGWDKHSIDWIETHLHMPIHKVGSPDMTNDELLEYIAATGKPMIVSTGMSREEEIDHCVSLLKQLGVSFALLHANNTYPAPFDEINLAYMDVLRKYGVPVGYSGHERGTSVAMAAVARGACVIERHITVDKSLEGPDHKASLLPDEFAQMVRGIRQVEQAIGDGVKKITRAEIMNREILGKSVVAAKFISDGMRITRDMLTTKSPAKGLSPQRLNEIVGITAQRDIFVGEALTEDDIQTTHALESFDWNSLPWKWGPVVRFHEDFKQYLRYQPKVFEFHLSDKDLESELPAGTYEQELVVHAPEYMHRTYLNPASEDSEELRISREALRQAAEVTRRLGERFVGTPKLIVHPGGITLEPHPNPTKLLDIFAETLASLAKYDIEILPENLPPRPWVFGGEWVGNIFLLSAEIKDFLDRERLHMCFDTSHAQLALAAAQSTSGQMVSLQTMLSDLMPYIRHLHVADGSGVGEEGLQIGEGVIDWKSVVAELENYPHTLVPEVWQGHLHEGRGFLQAMKHRYEFGFSIFHFTLLLSYVRARKVLFKRFRLKILLG